MVDISKNPLSIMFGSFLQKERKFMKISSEEACESLGLGTSFYRMIESGNANLHVNRAFLLVKFLRERRLVLDKVCKFLSAIQYIDMLIVQNVSPQIAMDSLAKNDSDFELFYDETSTFFKLNDDIKQQKQYLQDIVSVEVRKFLENKYNDKQTSSQKFSEEIFEEISAAPSLNVDLIYNMVKAFTMHPPLHFGKFAQEWEESEKRNFTALKGLYLNVENIISEENFKGFQYSYLLEDEFTEIQFVFVTEKASILLKTEFIEKLNKSRKASGKKQIPSENFNKLKIKTISNEQIAKYKANLFLDPYDLKKELQAFWVFSTNKGNDIGFIGVKEGDINNVFNLSYSETIKRGLIFDAIYSSL